jgi:UDP-N-acetylmuramoylalanine--D-glutamate ligase
VLIAGGDAKGVALAPIGALADRLSGVVAIGSAADEVVGIFQGTVPTRKAGSIEEAVRTAFELARRDGTVLLAPACASWDMFRDYAERGDRFAAAARGIEREVGP